MRGSLVRNSIGVLAALALGIGLVLAATSSPDAFQGEYVRIMYMHVPGAWLAFLAFGVTALGSAGWLLTRRDGWDRLAEASAEIGVLFTGVALFTGSLWGRPVWGTYWDWGDARMASTALMFFVYLGYLALRRATPDPTARARRAAVLGLVAVVQVPIVYFSVTFWRSLHQGFTVRPDGVSLEGSMVGALLVNLLAFTLLYGYLMMERMRIARIAGARMAEAAEAAGAAVTSPNLEGLS
ncbi:MAG TPA: cytochrome c biogenesis protein CcsA [Acidimicrobiia bacterium]